MISGLVAKTEIEINVDVSKVWNALIDPELIKLYLFGTEAVSDWKVGSYIIFRGSWEGKFYEDKGLILKSETNKIFEYAYWTAFSSLEDKIENYVDITYELVGKGLSTLLTVYQGGVANEEMVTGVSENWNVVLQGLKKIVEESIN